MVGIAASAVVLVSRDRGDNVSSWDEVAIDGPGIDEVCPVGQIGSSRQLRPS